MATGAYQILDKAWNQFHGSGYLDRDPLGMIRAQKDDPEREHQALLAALLSYGNVKQIRKSIGVMLAAWETGHMPRHRFQTPRDVQRVWEVLREEKRLFQGLSVADRSDQWAEEILGRISQRLKRPTPGIRFLLANPKDGGACKRIFMFLRWMVREDQVDPGWWRGRGFCASKLIMPLDTHSARISRQFGFLERKTTDLKAALELTEVFRSFDPWDPVRFDFSLVQLGMEGQKYRLSNKGFQP